MIDNEMKAGPANKENDKRELIAGEKAGGVLSSEVEECGETRRIELARRWGKRAFE